MKLNSDLVTKISVIITTRSRPLLAKRAVSSVVNQSYVDKEIIVVIDGIAAEHSIAYNELRKDYGNQVLFVELPYRDKGHGPSFARNHGTTFAQGDFISFLDDDDEWNDRAHLLNFARFSENIGRDAVDIFITHQVALLPNNELAKQNVWLEELNSFIDTNKPQRVSLNFLLQSNGFAHLNNVIVKTSLFEQLGGFDEGLRYEEDRDFYYRVVDKAQGIFFSPAYIGTHFIPPAGQNASTCLSKQQKLLIQLTSSLKLLSSLRSKILKDTVSKNASYICESYAELNQMEYQYDKALLFTRMASLHSSKMKRKFKLAVKIIGLTIVRAFNQLIRRKND